MKKFFAPNISSKGRLMRFVIALVFFTGAAFAFKKVVWLGLVLLVSGAFVLFEAVRGWCVMRACGIKTKL